MSMFLGTLSSLFLPPTVTMMRTLPTKAATITRVYRAMKIPYQG
jgi:hypothetical protein